MSKGPGAPFKFFFACPRGAEMCGPEFTPDGRTLFVAPQHPASWPTSRRPSRNPRAAGRTSGRMPPRPSVVVITKDDGGPIGS